MNTAEVREIQKVIQEYNYANSKHEMMRNENEALIRKTSDKKWIKKYNTNEVDVSKLDFNKLPYDLKKESILEIRDAIKDGELDDFHEDVDIENIDLKLQSDILEFLERDAQDAMEKAFTYDSISAIREAMKIYDVYDKVDRHYRIRANKIIESSEKEL